MNPLPASLLALSRVFVPSGKEIPPPVPLSVGRWSVSMPLGDGGSRASVLRQWPVPISSGRCRGLRLPVSAPVSPGRRGGWEGTIPTSPSHRGTGPISPAVLVSVFVWTRMTTILPTLPASFCLSLMRFWWWTVTTAITVMAACSFGCFAPRWRRLWNSFLLDGLGSGVVARVVLAAVTTVLLFIIIWVRTAAASAVPLFAAMLCVWFSLDLLRPGSCSNIKARIRDHKTFWADQKRVGGGRRGARGEGVGGGG